jgi:hypothetical protein
MSIYVGTRIFRTGAMIGVALAGAIWVPAVFALTAAGGGSPAATQLQDPEAAVVQELVVVASPPGPAWWTIERGEASIYIMGLPDEPLPKGQLWDHATLRRHLGGAAELIIPVEATAGFSDGRPSSIGVGLSNMPRRWISPGRSLEAALCRTETGR